MALTQTRLNPECLVQMRLLWDLDQHLLQKLSLSRTIVLLCVQEVLIFLYSNLLYEKGHYILDIQYIGPWTSIKCQYLSHIFQA